MTKSVEELQAEVANLRATIEGTDLFEALEFSIARIMELEGQLRHIRDEWIKGDNHQIAWMCDEVLKDSKVLPVGHPGHPQTPRITN